MNSLPYDHWLRRGALVLDTETTGVDVETARIGSISAGMMDVAAPAAMKIDTDYIAVDMPAEAGAVNGLTTEFLAEHGGPAAQVLEKYAALVADTLKAGVPVIIANAPFDLTVLDRECRRNGVRPVNDRIDPVWGNVAPGPVIDPIVLDKKVEKYRRRVSETQGARCLKTLCEVHGVGWVDELAHTSEYDARQAGLVTAALLSRYPLLRSLSLADLHGKQVVWYHEQAVSLRDYFLRESVKRSMRATATLERDPVGSAADAAESRVLFERAGSVSVEWPIRPISVQRADQGVGIW